MRSHLGASLTVDGGGDDATGIACSLATGEETLEADVLQGEIVAENTYRTGGAGLCSYECGFIGQEAMTLTTKGFETFLQTMGNERRHPEMQRTTDKSRCIAAVREIVAQMTIDEVCHALGWGSLLSVTLLPAALFQLLLKTHHAERIRSLCRVSVVVVRGSGAATLYLGEVFGMNLHDHATV